MDATESALYSVVQATAITSAGCAFLTGLHGIWRRNPNYGLLASSAAVNSGITAATFFSLRQYVVSPALRSTSHRRQEAQVPIVRAELNSGSASSGSLSWSDLRTHNILDSTISGTITGGLLRGVRSGPRTVIPGAVIGAVFCAAVQLGYNEIDVIRLKYVTRQMRQPPPADADAEAVSKPLFERILSHLGLTPVPEEQYLEMLKKKRDKCLSRIQELEDEAAGNQ